MRTGSRSSSPGGTCRYAGGARSQRSSTGACLVGTRCFRIGVIGISLRNQGQLVLRKALKIRRHFLRIVITIGRRFSHRGQGDGIQAQRLALRKVHAGHLGRGLRVLLHVLEGNGQRRFAVEGRLAGRQFVEDTAGGVDIRTGVGGLSARLLWREVLGSANDGGGLRHRRRAIAQRAGDTEVHDLHRAGIRDHHVRRLDIAVNNARFVGKVQGIAYLRHHRGGVVKAHLAGVLDDVAQRLSVYALHHDVRHGAFLVGSLASVVHSDDRRVVQLRCVLRLAAETLQEGLVARQVGAHHLHSDIATQQLIGSSVDVGHTAGADGGAKAVSAA